MRNTQEAYILVELKDGSQYVCAMNKPRPQPQTEDRMWTKQSQTAFEKQVIWN